MMMQIYLIHTFNGLPPVIILGRKEYREVADGYVFTRDSVDYFVPNSNIKGIQTTKGQFI